MRRRERSIDIDDIYNHLHIQTIITMYVNTYLAWKLRASAAAFNSDWSLASNCCLESVRYKKRELVELGAC
jgi:hypothetical protein